MVMSLDEGEGTIATNYRYSACVDHIDPPHSLEMTADK